MYSFQHQFELCLVDLVISIYKIQGLIQAKDYFKPSSYPEFIRGLDNRLEDYARAQVHFRNSINELMQQMEAVHRQYVNDTDAEETF